MRHTQLLGKVRKPDEPMFLARDTVRPYTYSALLADFTTWVRGTEGASSRLAPHGLRVLGYNLSKCANGLELTVAHGGWRSDGTAGGLIQTQGSPHGIEMDDSRAS